MISYLQGKIIDLSGQNITLLTSAGVGYLISICKPAIEKIKINENIELFIYTKVREDEISLFGFFNKNELEFFNQLLSVNGIGPKSALEILSQNIEQVKLAIVQENAAILSKIPGIGKKTAERIILELKNKINSLDSKLETPADENLLNDAISALTTLGYQRHEIIRTLKKLPAEIQETEQIVTYFLQNH